MERTRNDDHFQSELSELRLLHLTDSALPIGALAHSFGLESLVAQQLLDVARLPEFLRGFLEEAGFLEAVFCRHAWRLPRCDDRGGFVEGWLLLNEQLSALKPSRESRAGSASLGKNFLTALAALEGFGAIQDALQASKKDSGLIHHSAAFGLVAGLLQVPENRTVLAYLHQSIASLVSACQRLLPLGQSAATRILWELKPAMIEIAARSSNCELEDAVCFMPLLDWGAMEHPALMTRLFIS
jgi:urease accessory protein